MESWEGGGDGWGWGRGGGKRQKTVLEQQYNLKVFKKTMNNKMVKNTNLSTIESEKQTKQTRRTENHGYGKRFDGCQMGGVMEEWVKRRGD